MEASNESQPKVQAPSLNQLTSQVYNSPEVPVLIKEIQTIPFLIPKQELKAIRLIPRIPGMDNTHRHTITPYKVFSMAVNDWFKHNFPMTSFVDRIMTTAFMWKQFSDEEKEPYIKEAAAFNEQA